MPDVLHDDRFTPFPYVAHHPGAPGNDRSTQVRVRDTDGALENHAIAHVQRRQQHVLRAQGGLDDLQQPLEQFAELDVRVEGAAGRDEHFELACLFEQQLSFLGQFRLRNEV
jgi:hypothetical protein